MSLLAATKEVNLLITDSGLGGLSVCAEVVRNLKRQHSCRSARITYFNAWPEQDRGYNLFDGLEERARVFDGALRGMERFRPDLILIACNTLSVLYPRTRFSREAAVPVTDIIGFGVELIAQGLVAQPDGQALILGTPTTVEAGVHRDRLLERGIEAGRIVQQPCDRLAGEIEKDPDSATVREMIGRYARQAAQQAGRAGRPTLAALCCTHYGYAEGVFREKLEEAFAGPVTLLNPNGAMASSLFDEGGPAACGASEAPEAQVSVEVVSRIVLSQKKIDSIAKILEAASTETAAALRHYQHDPALFTF